MRTFPIAILSSRSNDGQIASELIRRVGSIPICGSSSRGGVSALRELIEVVSTGVGCAVLADGFYEWQVQPDGPKQPWFITTAGGGPFLIAGLWEHWDKGGAPMQSCTLLTTEATDDLRQVHGRMPVILPRQALAPWLTAAGSDGALEVLDSLGPVELRMQPVSRAVNSPAHEGADLIRPIRGA